MWVFFGLLWVGENKKDGAKPCFMMEGKQKYYYHKIEF